MAAADPTPGVRATVGVFVGMARVFWLAALLAACGHGAEAARILVVLIMDNRSHAMIDWTIIRALSARGHQVDVYGPVPPAQAVANVTFHQLTKGGAYGTFDVTSNAHHVYLTNIYLPLFGLQNCEDSFSDPGLQELITSQRKYDLLVNELFDSDCVLGFAHHFQVPVVSFSPSPLLPWGNARFGNPDNPAYVPNVFSGFTDEMNLWQRAVNAAILYLSNVAQWLYFQPRNQAIVDKAFGPGQPSLQELSRETSVLLVNTFHALSLPRPFATNVIEVGGLHIPEGGPKPLPDDLEQFVAGAKDGVVLFSLGTVVRTSSMSRETAANLLRVLGTLKQRVIWKWEDDSLGEVPSNVLLAKWLPQLDVLCHQNTRLIIGHGGLLSTSEVAYCGKPLLGIPFFGDQPTNMAAIMKAGAGRMVHFDTLKDPDVFIKHVKELLDDPSFRENAESLSSRFRDRPLTPLQTAMYWIEYVIRHKGAPGLRVAARKLAWYQEALLDVFAVAAVAVLALCALLWQALRLVRGLVAGAASSAKKKQA